MIRVNLLRPLAAIGLGAALSLGGIAPAMADDDPSSDPGTVVEEDPAPQDPAPGDPPADDPKTPEPKTIDLQFYVEECVEEGWAFVITDIAEADAPDSITVTLESVDDGSTKDFDAEIVDYVEAEGAYYALDNVGADEWMLWDASAVVPGDWDADFIWLGGPDFCEVAEEPTPSDTEKPKPPIKKIVTGVADDEAAGMSALLAGAGLAFFVASGVLVTARLRREH